MSKRKKKLKEKYLPGATWKDVLRGRPVTNLEAARQNGQNPMVQCRCRSCGFQCKVRSYTGLRERTHRCERCGGILDPLGPVPNKPEVKS